MQDTIGIDISKDTLDIHLPSETSEREAAHHFGISRDSVQKMLAYSVLPRPAGPRRGALCHAEGMLPA